MEGRLIIKSGNCFPNNVDYLLAGSIRDDLARRPAAIYDKLLPLAKLACSLDSVS